MRYDPIRALKSYRNIQVMLKGIPRQVWHIFLPESKHDLVALERNIIALKCREADREKVITIQKMCGFPLRPNVPLHEAMARLKIHELKKGKFSADDIPDDQESA